MGLRGRNGVRYSSPIERILANSVLHTNNKCWLWVRQFNNADRPVLAVRERGKRSPTKQIVTRYILKNVLGVKIRKRVKVAAHRCNNMWCVNPECLIYTTQKQNVADQYVAGTHVNQLRARAVHGPALYA